VEADEELNADEIAIAFKCEYFSEKIASFKVCHASFMPNPAAEHNSNTASVLSR
jgi:hypothetical protein